jgi:hypothetical protein
MEFITNNYIDNIFIEYKDINNTIINWTDINDEIPIIIQPNTIKKIVCSITNCTFKNYKDSICRFHYNKTHNLLCNIQDCNNLKRKNNLCYKHIKPLCCIIRCKCYAMINEVLCKKHKKFKIERII